MKYYTSSISQDLAKKLKAAGMPIEKEGNNIWCPPYAEVFDWLMDKGLFISINREWDFASEEITERFEWIVEKVGTFLSQPDIGGYNETWHEAANKAIKKLIELIN